MPQEETHKPRHMARYLILLVVIVLLVIIYRYFNPSLGFKYYEPAYLPPGISVKEKRISITRGYAQAEQNFRTVDWVYSIREYKPDGDTIGSAEQNYDTNSTEPTCNLLKTEAGQQYRLCHWIDYGRIGVYEVKFIKSGTFINAQIPTTLQQKISTEDISKFVSSFKSKGTAGIPVLRSNGP